MVREDSKGWVGVALSLLLVIGVYWYLTNRLDRAVVALERIAVALEER